MTYITKLFAGTHSVLVSEIAFDCFTNVGSVTIVLPKLDDYIAYRNKSGSNLFPAGYSFADISNNASVNNIIIEASAGDLINGASSVTINTSGASGIINVSGSEWSVNSSTITASDHILVGKITSEQINAKPANVDIVFNFPNAKPANKNVLAVYFKCFGVFTSPTRDIKDIAVEFSDTGFVATDEPFSTINNIGSIMGLNIGSSTNSIADIDIHFNFILDGVNPQDFVAGGEVGVYIEVENFPTLN